MSVKNILVAYSGTESSDAAVGATVQMHEKYGAHVTGIYVRASPAEQIMHQNWIPANLRDLFAGIVSEDTARLKDMFHRTIGGRIPENMLHWIASEGHFDATVADYVRMFDVTVVGRRDTVVENPAIELHPDRIAFRSGRPVLIIPQAWAPERIHEHAVIAWDGHRAVTSALADAMQILETKSQLTILRVKDRNLAPSLPGIDVETALRRHGLSVESLSVIPGGKSVGEEILHHCTVLGAGLLVMGAYERSVFREEILGGTTKYVLENARLPILIAH